MRQGLTLMETILATFVVSMVILAILQMLPSSALATKKAECKIQACSLAVSALDAQLARGFTAVAHQQGLDLELPDVSSGGVVYHLTVRVLDTPQPRPTLVKVVRCTVEWNFGGQDFSTTQEAWLSKVKGG
ncbi:MAG: hypothetical protein J0I12_21135 [Candidatus Eremiobacteraeota bacterium]|nr:hypothetical protein [Candidatus Eremiobacteraeota bacterium]